MEFVSYLCEKDLLKLKKQALSLSMLLEKLLLQSKIEVNYEI